MGLLRKLAASRERQILEHAEPFLDEGETVLAWIRTSRPHKRAKGLMFLTETRVIVSWSKVSSDENHSVAWDEIRSWGISADDGRGPLFTFETDRDSFQAHILVGTQGMVSKANEFLVRFMDRAPQPQRELEFVEDPEAFRVTEVHVQQEKKTVGKHTRRVVVTIIGVLLLVVGAVLLVVPGPGLLVTFAGLAVLGSEYDWAQDILSWARERYQTTKAKLRARRSTS